MKTLLKIKFIIVLILGYLVAIPAQVQAVCPVCTVAVGAGLGISRWLGIDDSIAGLWIGALALSSGLWLAGWVSQKEWDLPKKEWLAGSLFYFLLIPTLYLLGIAGNPLNTLWGIDKIILGIVIGTGVFAASVVVDKRLRLVNGNQVYLYYQKVILPMLFLSIVSFIFHLIT
jgi:hypothetical protein